MRFCCSWDALPFPRTSRLCESSRRGCFCRFPVETSGVWRDLPTTGAVDREEKCSSVCWWKLHKRGFLFSLRRPVYAEPMPSLYAELRSVYRTHLFSKLRSCYAASLWQSFFFASHVTKPNLRFFVFVFFVTPSAYRVIIFFPPVSSIFSFFLIMWL